jgi:hypothetical protein
VIASIVQPDGTAPMAEFANVFDPSGDPQKAMVGMMQVSECGGGVIGWLLLLTTKKRRIRWTGRNDAINDRPANIFEWISTRSYPREIFSTLSLPCVWFGRSVPQLR